MTGLARSTVSPSSSRTTRSTPWVDGCCGPRLTIIVSSDSGHCSGPTTRSRGLSVTGSPSSGPLCFLELDGHPGRRIVLAERVPLPVVGHEQANEVGMPGEAHPEEVVDLPLRQLRPGEELEEALDLAAIAVGHLADQPEPAVAGMREEVGHHLEPFPVDPG